MEVLVFFFCNSVFRRCFQQQSSADSLNILLLLMSSDAEILAVLKDPRHVLLDVRSPAEFAQHSIPGSINIPHTEIAQQRNKLPQDKVRDF